MITSIRHSGLVVNDLEKSLNFWINILGFKLVKKMVESGPKIDSILGLENVKVTTAKLSDHNGNIIELLKFHSHQSKEKWEGKPYSIGLTHLALSVDNFDELVSKFSESGIVLKNKPVISDDNKVKVVYIESLEGLLLEIVETL
tara:strand:- start:94 stop:525 length:432 start_codon:yes stop_codon:yes gene_type:complete